MYLFPSCLGGPLTIFSYTPLRNALTLGSKDARSTIGGLYAKVFRGGLRAGWTGGLAPAVIACPQFLALGPMYHLIHGRCKDLLGVPAERYSAPASLTAAAGASLAECLLTFGSQSRNAQMAYNKAMVSHASVRDGSRRTIPVNSPALLWGVGAGPLWLRNAVSLASVRCLSPLFAQRVPDGVLSPQVGAGCMCMLCVCGCICMSMCMCMSIYIYIYIYMEREREREKERERARYIYICIYI